MPANRTRLITLCAATLLNLPTLAQQNQTLLATPTTVAWGFYSAKATPALTIHSGDTVTIQTLSTCGSPERLKSLGIAASDIPPSVADIYTKPPPHPPSRPRRRPRSPQPKNQHRRPLGLQRLRCRPRLPPQRLPLQPHPHHPSRPRKDDRPLRPRHRLPPPPLLRQHGHRPSRVRRQIQLRPTLDARRQHRQQRDGRRHHTLHSHQLQGRQLRGRRR